MLRPYAWAFQKHSPYLDCFNFYLQEFKEKGAWDAIKSKYESRPQVCPNMSGMPIEFSSCFTAFLALIGGIFIAFIIMLIECRKSENLKKIISPNPQNSYLCLTFCPPNCRFEEHVPRKSESQSGVRLKAGGLSRSARSSRVCRVRLGLPRSLRSVWICMEQFELDQLRRRQFGTAQVQIDSPSSVKTLKSAESQVPIIQIE